MSEENLSYFRLKTWSSALLNLASARQTLKNASACLEKDAISRGITKTGDMIMRDNLRADIHQVQNRIGNLHSRLVDDRKGDADNEYSAVRL